MPGLRAKKKQWSPPLVPEREYLRAEQQAPTRPAWQWGGIAPPRGEASALSARGTAPCSEGHFSLQAEQSTSNMGETKPEYCLLTPMLASLSWAPADMCVGNRVRIRHGEGLSSCSTYWWNSMLCCGHMPRLCRTAFRLVSMSFPPMSTVPDVGGSRPVRTDLPNTDIRGRKDGLRSALWSQPPPQGQWGLSQWFLPLPRNWSETITSCGAQQFPIKGLAALCTARY